MQPLRLLLPPPPLLPAPLLLLQLLPAAAGPTAAARLAPGGRLLRHHGPTSPAHQLLLLPRQVAMLWRLHLIGEGTPGSTLLMWHWRLLAVLLAPAARTPAARPLAGSGRASPLLHLLLVLLLLLPVEPSSVVPASAIAKREVL